ncbi:MAG: hypothetical protein EPN48_17680 [Microbacteriaceae bacterium]|nr:MAG: hypothetical protein EPN48_17680 [Microbacteriaceae bacterium]
MSRVITIIGFCVCGVLAILLVLTSRRNPDKTSPLGELLDRVMASRAVRITILVFWWWLGWHFLVTPPLPPG